MIGSRLKQRRLALGLSLQQVADALLERGTKITRAALSKYELAQGTPNAIVLREISQIFGVKTEYFFADAVADVQWYAYRKRANMSQTDQDRIQAQAVEILESRVKAEELCGVVPEDAERPERQWCETLQQAEQLSRELREKWRLDDHPIASVIDLLESKDYITVPVSTGELQFDGLSGLLNQARPVIVYKDDVVVDRLRFTVAHELAHRFLRNDDESLEEKLAHHFAAAFLITDKTLRKHLGERRSALSLRELILLKEQYGISIQALVFRASSLGIIPERLKVELFQAFGRMGIRKAEPGRYAVSEKPDQQRRILLRGIAEGVISEDQAQELDPGLEKEDDMNRDKPTWDLRSLLSLPLEERDKILEEASANATALYGSDGLLSGLEIVDSQ